MSDQLEPSTTPAPTPTDPPAAPASAVDRCAQAWKRNYELASLLPKKERHREEYDRFVNDEAASAFRDAMPPLIGLQNIQEYIACVAYAQLHDIFTIPECQRLFETARFALTVPGNKPGR
jgi:hypothetical protein